MEIDFIENMTNQQIFKACPHFVLKKTILPVLFGWTFQILLQIPFLLHNEKIIHCVIHKNSRGAQITTSQTISFFFWKYIYIPISPMTWSTDTVGVPFCKLSFYKMMFQTEKEKRKKESLSQLMEQVTFLHSVSTA